jgi:hypothetical protein
MGNLVCSKKRIDVQFTGQTFQYIPAATKKPPSLLNGKAVASWQIGFLNETRV